MKKFIAKVLIVTLAVVMAAALASCGGSKDSGSDAEKTYKIGLCNYVDDASLNQIVKNIKTELEKQGEENKVAFEVNEQNCNADSNVMNQIISDFQADNVDLMIGVATPVAIGMQAATEGTDTPVVFSAVSDPVGAKLVESMEKPGANLTGTSDYLDTNAVFDLMFALNKDIKTVGLLYDQGQDSSTAPIKDAKKYLEKKGVKVVEHTGTTVDEVKLAADAMVADKVDAVFTPTDNTIMTAELSIYETFAKAKIPHYTGADSFALNGAFLGYGVNYAKLGVKTAEMVADILINEKDPAEVGVETFDNGTATVNTDICEELGLDFEELKETFGPYCDEVKEIKTSEEFEE